mmetsp:Transcript_6366/g.10076  ORF Transcript_6366/g.10076 Transcript_6366/m.10076 type:complete len:274 (-) Transcript_6366:136-957(-)|eukprot:CAMPEP_0202693320 /NCGR_PEP_ID=MMETSP1385-20130828/7466_1 /ASSEMBLY_ACC=CAM_ASM_000861 /TAXON_ID=933848 /ORGANISM="Elphidium margaritaceum" /LENGTH=273 /DNA_ID=CAMNT_0049348981 /DNA_START=53 /DNA_END=874 /DNA_ORIENTATION=-
MNDSLMGTSINEIGRDIQKLSRDVKQLERRINSIGTSTDTEHFRSQLRDDIHATTSLVKHLLSSIQDLKSQEEAKGGKVSIKLERAEKQFIEQYTKFQQLVSSAKNAFERTNVFKADRVPQNNAMPSKGYDLGHINMDDMDNVDQYENHPNIAREEQESAALQTSQAFIPQFDNHLAELEDREQAVHQMVEDLTELNSMYKDLHCLVDEQGSQIEVLSSNVQNAKEDVKQGVVHLDKAAEHQKKSRKKMCILLLIVLIVALVLTIVIYYGTRS